MRRDSPEPANDEALSFGPFLLDRAGGRLVHQGQPVDLAPKPWAVLAYLAARPGRLVGKDELLDAVWGHRHVSDSVLKVTVNALRNALGDDAKAPRWLHTVSRRGYRFSDAVRGPSMASGASTTALAAANARPLGNLPTPGQTLIGRADAVAAVQLAMTTHRLVTLTGPGGVGKTCLALQVAAFEAPVDGVWLLRLEPFASAAAVTAALASTVGLSDGAGRSTEALGRALAPLRLRLVLDNAEHLVEVLAAPLATWLMAAPGLRVLCTSQRALNISGEQRLPLRPLALPDLSAHGASPADSPAVALLLQRVQALEPDWRADAAALSDAAAIAHALDGLPLALELAAARVPLLGMAGVRERLDARLKLLTHGLADAPDRHRTLRAALEWSVGLLPPPAAAVLDWLSVFAASFTLDAAQAVAAQAPHGLDEMALIDAIALLRDMALLVPASEAAPVGRLRMYDSVRMLAAERLAARAEDRAARAALRRWLTRCFSRAFDRVAALPQEPWLALQEAEGEHLQVAMASGMTELQPHAQVGLLAELAELGGVSVVFCIRAGLKHLSAGWLATMRRAAESLAPAASGDTLLALDIHTTILASPGLVIDPSEGLAAAERAWPLLRGRGQIGPAMYVLHHAGHLTMRLRRNGRCTELTAEIRAIEPPAANLYERRLAGWLDALQARVVGLVEPYNRFCAEMLQQSRARGDGPEAWIAAMGLGQALYLQGQGDAAVAVLDEAVDEVRSRGRLRVQVPLVAQAAVLRLTRDAGPDTVGRLREAVQVLKSEGMVWWLADALAWVPLWDGRNDDSRRVQAWADGLLAARGEPRGPVFARLRAEWAARIGDDTPPDMPPLDEDGALRLARAWPH